MGPRKVKKEILLLLNQDSLEIIEDKLSQYTESDVIGSLFSAICSVDETCKWHGVSSFGFVVSRLAVKDIEAARIIMRRFLWSLNDESGGIGWGAPEAMAEIMLLSDTLFT